ncbi:MAG TPA: helix-turn-helix domain-containing protein [Thermoanaerobaculia bacterium]|nr:helix-turn-helix domain-containing protein [Thermoanaerobaculia bacterium]
MTLQNSRAETIWLLPLYAKNEAEIISPHQLRRIAKIGQEILEGIRQLKRGETGRFTNFSALASIRERTGLSQAQFARLLIGVSVRKLQDWEQGRRTPSGPARLAGS